MKQDPDRPWLTFDSPDDYLRARELLSVSGYSAAGIQERLGLRSMVLPNSEALLVRKTTRGDTLDTLLRLFLAGVPVPLSQVQSALAPIDPKTWVDAGLISVDDNAVEAKVKLLPSAEWVLAFDRHRRGAPHSQDMVLGVGHATLSLINLSVRRPVHKALDLGTGCGIQAFFASTHSEQVFAVDRNPRAIRFADFNKRLNGIANVECREGDRFEPVRGMTFGFVTCNAPFVISPSSGYVSLDGGMEGDRFCASVAQVIPNYLDEGGLCQMLCNWAHLAGQSWEKRLSDWFPPRGCDVWVIRTKVDEAANYARLWIQEIYGEDSDQFDQRYHEWMNFYERAGIEAMSMGLINIRRTDDRPTRVLIDDAPEIVEASGVDIWRRLEAREFLLVFQDDRTFLDTRLRTSPELRLEHRYQRSGQDWRIAVSRLFLQKGFAYSVTPDPILAEFLVRCDGTTTVRTALEAAGGALNVSLAEALPDCLRVVRRCVDLGFLEPVQD
jgi:methylase of polypeptide subunit release factors